jgi:hypothetical protein
VAPSLTRGRRGRRRGDTRRRRGGRIHSIDSGMSMTVRLAPDNAHAAHIARGIVAEVGDGGTAVLLSTLQA